MTSQTSPPDVGRRLAAARLQRGLSQGTVARLAGFAPSYLSRIETGKVHPTFRTVVRIADALKVTPEEILGPERPGARDSQQVCPVSQNGRCLLDLIRREAKRPRNGSVEAYSPRQIRLLKRFATWMRTAPSDRLRAMEILMEDLAAGERD